MSPVSRFLGIAVACLALSGCYLVDGAAQVAKLAAERSKGSQDGSTAPPAAQAQSQSAPVAQNEPPPPEPASIRPAPSVQVEELN